MGKAERDQCKAHSEEKCHPREDRDCRGIRLGPVCPICPKSISEQRSRVFRRTCQNEFSFQTTRT